MDGVCVGRTRNPTGGGNAQEEVHESLEKSQWNDASGGRDSNQTIAKFFSPLATRTNFGWSSSPLYCSVLDVFDDDEGPVGQVIALEPYHLAGKPCHDHFRDKEE